jgi:3-(3-hydroxy-phenyl)propionate hydroxylase/6-hydroxy-3-succinoylpyridine 3-monooxygenase
VGLTLAIGLAKAGRSVEVLEREPELGDSPRAICYLHNLLPDLDRLGLLDEMKQLGHVDQDGFTLRLPLLEEVINVPMTTLIEDRFPYPYNINLGQDQVARIAERVLHTLPTATLRFDADVTAVRDQADGATVTYTDADGEHTVKARYVVGADGGHSTVRKAIGASLEGTTWKDRFVATNVRFPFEELGFNSSNLLSHPEYGCVVARISPDGLWRVTYQESDSLPEETVEERIPAHFERLLGAEDAARVVVDRFRPYRMHQRLATKLHEGHIVLAGDAAHLTNPTGGLGLTGGLYDVFLLEEVLLSVLSGESGQEALEYYAKDRARVFSTISSPNASYLKDLVYDTPDPEKLRELTQSQRDAASAPQLQRASLEGIDDARSPLWASTKVGAA